jgi:hypothetical protein
MPRGLQHAMWSMAGAATAHTSGYFRAWVSRATPARARHWPGKPPASSRANTAMPCHGSFQTQLVGAARAQGCGSDRQPQCGMVAPSEAVPCAGTTYLPTYLRTYVPTYLRTCLPTLPTCLPTTYRAAWDPYPGMTASEALPPEIHGCCMHSAIVRRFLGSTVICHPIPSHPIQSPIIHRLRYYLPTLHTVRRAV